MERPVAAFAVAACPAAVAAGVAAAYVAVEEAAHIPVPAVESRPWAVG